MIHATEFAQHCDVRFVLRILFASFAGFSGVSFGFVALASALAGYISGRIRTSQKVQRANFELKQIAMLRAIVENLPDLIYVKDIEGHFQLVNQGAADAYGARAISDVIGKTDFDFFPREMAERFRKDERNILATGVPLLCQEEYIGSSDGQECWVLTTKAPFRNAEDQIIGIVGISRSITSLKRVESELRTAQENLQFKAAHDSLTGLLNRGASLELLDREIARRARQNAPFGVLLGDLDRFKSINDEHGHLVGDQVLCEVARRLVHSVRPFDVVGRFGGEEFLIVLSDCGPDNVRSRSEQIREVVAAAPVDTAIGPMSVTISIGVLVVHRHEIVTAEDILREVDAALYSAKASGRNRCGYHISRLSQ